MTRRQTFMAVAAGLLQACATRMSDGGRPIEPGQAVAKGERTEVPEIFGKKGTGPGFFDGPIALSALPDGTILVVDAGNSRIQHVSANGDPLGVFGSIGSAPGQIRFPEGIAYLPDGSVVVSDGGNNRIQVFTADGRVRGVWGRSGAGP
ncbi:MAG: hypothetical protein EBV45_06725, partial [Chloroflexi bacterium]|nr:hypothetical protein [Chloroflexota bacterium]